MSQQVSTSISRLVSMNLIARSQNPDEYYLSPDVFLPVVLAIP
ncbi:hypothetical protein [Fibrella aestuarina]|nr:hypothetical protein [Fibrella aestuarina]